MRVRHIFTCIILLPVFWLVFSCSNQQNSAITEAKGGEAEEKAMVPDGATSQNSLDYTGTYTGITPCADCEGIEVSLTLNGDSSYTHSMLYLGKSDVKPVVTNGKYTWTTDGSTVALVGLEGSANKFKVGEGQIWQLDMSGKKIEGELAEKYILKKL